MRPPFCISDNLRMLNVHLDNPQKIEKWLETLDAEERAIFDRGYLTALGGVIEQLRDSKIKLLNRIGEVKEEGGHEEIETQLLSRVRILDIYDDHYTQRIDNLLERCELSELLPAFE